MRVPESQRGIPIHTYRDASCTSCSPLSMRARFAVLPYLKSLFRINSEFPQPRFYAASSVSRCTPSTLLLIVTFPRIFRPAHSVSLMKQDIFAKDILIILITSNEAQATGCAIDLSTFLNLPVERYKEVVNVRLDLD